MDVSGCNWTSVVLGAVALTRWAQSPGCVGCSRSGFRARLLRRVGCSVRRGLLLGCVGCGCSGVSGAIARVRRAWSLRHDGGL
eukprot:3964896-Pyramimonas_sp.AAC.1